ncbi:MAG: hypothetical protein QGH58_06570 [Arenicellales bacterium]|mgnify:CR=1 FL=1|jgi:hypothetical protein|nr:hypothetical protein [Arenicellales bacterium]MDP6791557.1 hypothetical protein [Arenicellales bacterium]|tara:strand:- start:1373 stop:1768 length:396 start_codon:yes stop_codon:yes gene_type:complete
MATQRGTSIVPLVLGAVGAGLQLPGAVCSAACAGFRTEVIEETSEAASQAAAQGALAIGVAAAVIGLVAALLGKKNPTLSGSGLIVATLITAYLVIEAAFTNIMSDIACILFLIAAVFAFVQKKESAENVT